MNTSNITNYKPKDFADLERTKNQIERNKEIAKEFQDGNQSDRGTEDQDFKGDRNQ